jgi:phosphate acetyltransferase
MNIEESKNLISDVSYFCTLMVYKGLVDGMVCGAVHTTSDTIRPVLKLIKNNSIFKTVSSIFFMILNNYVIVYGDCAILNNPNHKQLAEIAISATIKAINFEIKPIIALLSYSSVNSGYGIEVEKINKSVELVKIYEPNFIIEGPIQYDAAVYSFIGKKKLPKYQLYGKANIIIFPDLNTGNITYKAVQRETKCLAIGPILQCINKPITDLSRGAYIEDIYNTIIFTSIHTIYENTYY